LNDGPERRQYNIWIDPDGKVWIEDPDRGVLPLAEALQPSFSLAADVEGLPAARLQRTRRVPAPGPWPDDLIGLWALHDRLVESGTPEDGVPKGPTLLDLKRAIAARLFRACTLCEHRCGVDRLIGERGICKVGPTSYYADAYVHLGEEREIAPSLCLALTGCSWHCVYCHTFDIINRVDAGTPLLPPVYAGLYERAIAEARTLSFVGGNPDHHMPAILDFLMAAPEDFTLPLVWNSNMYGSPELYKLLDGLVDVYLGDLRYGNDDCAKRLSGLERCVVPVARNWQQVQTQGAVLIVRLLLLPGHVDCCLRPMVAWLQEHLPMAQVSLLSQFHPTYLVAKRAPEMNRTPTTEEVETARELIIAAELPQVVPMGDGT
jgi:putative pyruvate formate lyase activating enzyme